MEAGKGKEVGTSSSWTLGMDVTLNKGGASDDLSSQDVSVDKKGCVCLLGKNNISGNNNGLTAAATTTVHSCPSLSRLLGRATQDQKTNRPSLHQQLWKISVFNHAIFHNILSH